MEKKKEKLKKIAEAIADCRKCLLYQRAVKPVPGEGNPDAEIMFIGEGPGYWEDQQGRPFVGRAGKLLDSLLQSIKLKRSDVFITNVVKHRPPNNRDPLPEEIESCKEFLDAQIETINPKIIVTLGRFSLNKFLPGEYISRVHGQARFVVFAGKKRIIMPLYHPAAALRNQKIMEELRNDFQKILNFLKENNENLEEEEEEAKEAFKQLNLV